MEFSSSCTIIGYIGEASYAAANSFLDQLAVFRQHRGLPATTINWGPWGDVGLAKSLPPEVLSGFVPLSNREAIMALKSVLASTSTQVVVNRFGKTSYDATHRSSTNLEDSARRIALKGTHDAHILTISTSQTRRKNESQSKDEIHQKVDNAVRRILKVPGSRGLDKDFGFVEMGMDSLMMIEFRNELANAFRHGGQQLSSTITFDHPTIASLCNYLCTVLLE